MKSWRLCLRRHFATFVLCSIDVMFCDLLVIGRSTRDCAADLMPLSDPQKIVPVSGVLIQLPSIVYGRRSAADLSLLYFIHGHKPSRHMDLISEHFGL